MLKDVGYARGIPRGRAEAYAEGLVFVVVADGKQLGPGDLVLLDRSTQSFYDSVSRVFYGQVGK